MRQSGILGLIIYPEYYNSSFQSTTNKKIDTTECNIHTFNNVYTFIPPPPL